eukprot:10236970-Alexandrium_andersonii.AAC.1
MQLARIRPAVAGSSGPGLAGRPPGTAADRRPGLADADDAAEGAGSSSSSELDRPARRSIPKRAAQHQTIA